MGQNLGSLFLHLAHLIRSINDPEHPLTLEELNVVEQVRIQVGHQQYQRVVVWSSSQKGFIVHKRLVFSVHKHLRGSLGGEVGFPVYGR